MSLMFDSVTPQAIPPNPQIVAAYIDGRYANYTQARALFPAATLLSITVFGNLRANVVDVEYGDATPATAAAGVKAGLYPTVYCNLSTISAVVAAMDGTPFQWWAAHPTGTPHLVPGSIATQYAWPGYGSPGNYDISLTNGVYPYEPIPPPNPTPAPIPIPPPPPPVPPPTPYPLQGDEMICRDPKTGGYWAVRPSGNVYAYYGAPYIGPAPKYLTQWGIGTAANPVVGICSDGVDGFVLSADTDAFPGSPALYHITPSMGLSK